MSAGTDTQDAAGGTEDKQVKLACPECGSTDRLGTEERLLGTSFCEAIYRNPDGSLYPDFEGETDVNYDTSESTGKIDCRSCYWTGLESELVVAGEGDPLNAWELRGEVERIIGEDRVPVDVLRGLLRDYGEGE